MKNKQHDLLKVDKTILRKFREIKKKHLRRTEMPEKDTWKELSNDDIWKKMFEQVIIVGNSDPAETFKDEKYQAKVSYSRLLKMNNKDRERAIHEVLIGVGARYASKDIRKCKKTKALVGVFEVISKTSPKELIKEVSQKRNDREKIEYFMNKFRGMYIGGEKSARDFLVDIGMVKNAVALDVRIQKILVKIGALKKNISIGNSKKIYNKVEQEILEKICKPLNLTGVQFDKMLYNNYDEILKEIGIKSC